MKTRKHSSATGKYLSDEQFETLPKSETYAETPQQASVSDAAQTLRKALRDDEDFRFTYQSNIAMSFYDAMKPRLSNSQPISDLELNQIANEAATKFLNLWLYESEEK